MDFGFTTNIVEVRTTDGLNDVLLSPLDYVAKSGRIFRAPIGGTTDGLSVPRCVQNIIPATGGDWFSGVLHDSSYHRQLLELDKQTGEYKPAILTQAECDALILEAMESQGVGLVMRHTIYLALRLFGWKAYNEDAKK